MSTAVATPVAAQVQEWLSRFDQALIQGETAAAADLFGEPSFWRDLVAFTWNIKTVEGREGVKEMLDHTLARAGRAAGTRPRSRPRPTASSRPGSRSRPPSAAAAGHLRLDDGKAWTLLTTLDELKGHEEPTRRAAAEGRRARRRTATAGPGSRSASERPRSSATRRSPTS